MAIEEQVLEPEFDTNEWLFRIWFDFSVEKAIEIGSAKIVLRDERSRVVYDQTLEPSTMVAGPWLIKRTWAMSMPGSPRSIKISFGNGQTFQSSLGKLDERAYEV